MPNKPFNVTSSWTVERVEQCRALLSKGLSSLSIAKEIGGVSRNAVIGLVYRRGWTRPNREAKRSPMASEAGPQKKRTSVLRTENTRPSVRPPTVEPAALSAEPAAIIDPHAGVGVSIWELTDSKCRFPLWPNDAVLAGNYCGNAPALGFPYCVGHCHVAFNIKKKG